MNLKTDLALDKSENVRKSGNMENIVETSELTEEKGLLHSSHVEK